MTDYFTYSKAKREAAFKDYCGKDGDDYRDFCSDTLPKIEALLEKALEALACETKDDGWSVIREIRAELQKLVGEM